LSLASALPRSGGTPHLFRALRLNRVVLSDKPHQVANQPWRPMMAQMKAATAFVGEVGGSRFWAPATQMPEEPLISRHMPFGALRRGMRAPPGATRSASAAQAAAARRRWKGLG